MAAPLTTVEFMVFGMLFGQLLAEAGTLLTVQRRVLAALQPALVLGLPAGRTAVVAAQGVCPQRLMLNLRRASGLRKSIIHLLCVGPRAVVAAVVAALRELLQLLRGR